MRLWFDCVMRNIFFSIRVFFTDTDDPQTSRGREGTIFYSTLSLPPSQTLRHLFATLHVRWLSGIFNRNACIYQAATRWDFTTLSNYHGLTFAMYLVYFMFYFIFWWPLENFHCVRFLYPNTHSFFLFFIFYFILFYFIFFCCCCCCSFCSGIRDLQLYTSGNLLLLQPNAKFTVVLK